jgi:hypothetical protein
MRGAGAASGTAGEGHVEARSAVVSCERAKDGAGEPEAERFGETRGREERGFATRGSEGGGARGWARMPPPPPPAPPPPLEPGRAWSPAALCAVRPPIVFACELDGASVSTGAPPPAHGPKNSSQSGTMNLVVTCVLPLPPAPKICTRLRGVGRPLRLASFSVFFPSPTPSLISLLFPFSFLLRPVLVGCTGRRHC